MPAEESLAAIVPVLNEEAAIGDVVRALLATGLPSEVIVVDGGSSDRTVETAAAAGARVLVERRRGYGRACASGAFASQATVLAFLDGDGADDPASLERLLQPIADGTTDLVLGARASMEAGSLPFYATAGNRLAALIVKLAWRQRISDLPSFKALRRDTLVRLDMTEATYGWTIEMIVKAARRGLRIKEVPLNYRRRRGGQSKVSGNPRTSIRAAASILSALVRHGTGRNGGSTLLP
ncbi:MAG: glycosyltransferase [Chloroflexota bacterium]|nr:glycosyltransferase [Chloroflexota bacterium]